MSIRLRLALWYGGLAGLCVLLICALTYAIHSRAHYDDVDRVLAAAAEHTAREYVEGMLSGAPVDHIAIPSLAGLVVRVYSADARLLVESPGSEILPATPPRSITAQAVPSPFDPLVGLAPRLVRIEPGIGSFGLTRDQSGTRWRLYALPLNSTDDFLVTALPLDQIDVSVERFRLILLVLGSAGVLASFLAGTVIAGRALRPIAALTETAQLIAAAREWSRRVPADQSRDELGHLAATFNGMLDSLEEAYQAQQRFVADASHELRSPLTSIQANLQLLETEGALTAAERATAVREAHREARRLARLVADLLALARADAGIALRREPVELDRVLIETLRDTRHLVQGRRLQITDLEPARVAGDQDRLAQLVLILVDNALKYTPPGGEIALGLRHSAGEAEVTVRDTGPGIPKEDLPRVFERFYRADPTRSRDPGGTGLGLPIARWIVEQHGGTIVLSNNPQGGLTATVRILRLA